MSTAYLGIGSNLGDRRKNCLDAIEMLEQKGIIIKKKSSLYETEPWGVENQPMFLNMAIEIETDLKPGELLGLLKEVEKEVGRGKTYKWGPRIIDLDILLFDNISVDEYNLTIPHPLMHEREFVLKPLAEIAPDVTHPLLHERIQELLHHLIRK